MYVYMQVTSDRFELPVYVAESIKELAEMAKVSENTIRSSLSRNEKFKKRKSKYHKIEVEDDE